MHVKCHRDKFHFDLMPCVHVVCSSATDAAAGARGRALGGHRVPRGPDLHLLVLRAATAAAAAGAPAGAAAAHAPADPDGDDAAAIGAVRGTHPDLR